jgi:hypothetical protein
MITVFGRKSLKWALMTIWILGRWKTRYKSGRFVLGSRLPDAAQRVDGLPGAAWMQQSCTRGYLVAVAFYPYSRWPLVLAENVAYADQRFDLFCAEPGEQILAHRSRMNGPRSLQLLATVAGEGYENGALIGLTPLDEFSFLHPRELVREPALVPTHRVRQRLLTHLPFAKTGEPGQDAKLRS